MTTAIKNTFNPNPSGGLRPPTVTALPAIEGALEGESYYLNSGEAGTSDGHIYTANKVTGVWERGFSLTTGDELKEYIDDADAATLDAAKELMEGLAEPVDYAYDASGNTYPVVGSGTDNAVAKNDAYYIGTVGTVDPFLYLGTMLLAKVNNPGQTAGNWAIISRHFDYVPADAAKYMRMLYVDKRGNDTYVGSPLYPFLTINAALTKALTMSPSQSTPVIIIVSPGQYTEQVVIEKAGISIYGFGQGISYLKYEGNALKLLDNGVDTPPNDFKCVGMSIQSTNANADSVFIQGVATRSLGGNELQFRDCRIEGIKSVYSNIANYINYQNTYIMGSQLYEQTAGVWFEDSESAGAITYDYNNAGSKPSDTDMYGLNFVRHIPRGTVTYLHDGAVGEDKRPIDYKLTGFSSSYGEVAATDTHQQAIEKIVGTQDAKRGEFVYVAGSNGNNAYAGSQQKPLATVAQAITSTNSGDTIYLLPNNNYTENIAIADGQSRHLIGLSAGNGCLLNGTLTFANGLSGAFYGVIKNLDCRKKVLINGLGGQRFKDCQFVGTSVSISSITRSGTTATATVASTATLATGEYLKIAGANESNFNRTAIITVVDGTTFTYTVANSGATTATGTLIYYKNTLEVKGTLTNNITFDGGSIQNSDIIITSTSPTNDVQIKNCWAPVDIIINSGIVQLINTAEVGNITLNGGILLLTDNKLLKRITINATAASGSAVYLLGFNSFLQTNSTFEYITRADASKNAPIVCLGTLIANSALHNLYTTPITFVPDSGHDNIKEIDLTAASWTEDGGVYDKTIAAATHGLTKITGVSVMLKISGTGKWVSESTHYWEQDDTTKALYLNRSATPWAYDSNGTSENYVGKLFIKGIA